jgi:putative tryptophan/tyrosine transport system substrate-binding protein
MLPGIPWVGGAMQIIQLKRREFITLLSSAAALPLATRAQPAGIPVVGFLGAPSAAPYAQYVAAIHQGLKEAGYIEGQNVRFEYRWAEGHYERLPALAVELVDRKVSAIVPIGGAPSTVAAKTATLSIPIVFTMLADPLALGLVASLNRPGGNLTGIATMGVELEVKRLELLREAVPSAALIAMLVNPDNAHVGAQVREVQTAGQALGQPILILKASTERELEAAFGSVVKEGAGAILVGSDTFFTSKPVLFVLLTARHAVPAIYPWRSHVDAGGLMSYGASLIDSYRQAGVYTGRILKGEKPADLPILEPTKFELVINLQSAKAIGLTVSSMLLARADEVIE